MAERTHGHNNPDLYPPVLSPDPRQNRELADSSCPMVTRGRLQIRGIRRSEGRLKERGAWRGESECVLKKTWSLDDSAVPSTGKIEKLSGFC